MTTGQGRTVPQPRSSYVSRGELPEMRPETQCHRNWVFSINLSTLFTSPFALFQIQIPLFFPLLPPDPGKPWLSDSLLKALSKGRPEPPWNLRLQGVPQSGKREPAKHTSLWQCLHPPKRIHTAVRVGQTCSSMPVSWSLVRKSPGRQAEEQTLVGWRVGLRG